MSKTKITYNSNTKLGKVKAMHAVCDAPKYGIEYSYFKYLKEAHIPYSRLHDVGGWFGGNMYVDIPNIFRDFSADVEDPASYDFAFTDLLLAALVENGCEPYYRLGVTIENNHAIKAYRIFPPADYEKWARICEHVIRHYNEGWANGFHYNIKYWEIWNEAEDSYDPAENSMWKGTPEQFFELYRVASRHLRKCFGDSIKIGGWAACENSGIVDEKVCKALERGRGADLSDLDMTRWDYRRLDFIDFMRRFSKIIKEDNLPFDFFSHHSYNSVENVLKIQKFAEDTFHEAGLDDIEFHLNEWNPNNDDREDIGTSLSAANAAAMMCAMHNTKVNIMCYYRAALGISPYDALFSSVTLKPHCIYYSFKAFGELYEMGTQIECSSDNPQVYTLAATNGKKNGILISNLGETTDLTLECSKNAKVYLIDESHMMEEIDADLSSYELKKNRVLYIEEAIN